MLPVAILCGGKGTRMRESGESLPKPLVEVGAKPILWHVMSLYAGQGFRRFKLLLGHGERIEAFAATLPDDWEVSCLDTGLDTPTGGRVARAADHLREGTFCLTYADGVADLDLGALVAFHRDHRRAATMTVVRPRNPWGVAQLGDEGRIAGFVEKPVSRAGSTAASSSWSRARSSRSGPITCSSASRSRRSPRPASCSASVTRGSGTAWTYKDTLLLNELWARGEAPWQTLVEA